MEELLLRSPSRRCFGGGAQGWREFIEGEFGLFGTPKITVHFCPLITRIILH